ncbi:MAG: beta-propeller repeat-containing protein [Bacteroidetes bacterium]|nr:MAG: beta-propeller repeat-containing protein [Bacteroidota bacterium]
MKTKYCFSIPALGFALIFGFSAMAGNTEQASAGKTGFTENKGQVSDQYGNPAPQVLFRLTGNGKELFVTNEGLTYVFPEKKIAAGESTRWSKLEMQLAGAEIRPGNIECSSPLPGYSNYYYPHCAQGVLGVKTWQQVLIRSVYPGIDWMLKAEGENIQYDFIVHPGADPADIRLVYKGAEKMLPIDNDSKLKIDLAFGCLFEGVLKSWMEESGKNVHSRFRVKNNEVSFALAQYDKNETLIIDPPLQWTSTQVSSGMDYIFSVAAVNDGSGDVCTTGSTDGGDFPVLNPYQAMLGGNEDMIVQRLDGSNGNRIWSTYYGGGNYEAGKGVATDAAGNCYVTGYTGSTNFPVQNPFQANYGGGTFDAVFLKFNAAGVRQWASWYGGSSSEQGLAIAADAAGNSYSTGYTASSNFIALNGVQMTKNAGNDAFVVKLDNAAAPQFITFYGGDDDDKGRAITLHGNSVYFTGSTLSGVFPNTSGGFQSSNANAYNFEDAFITSMNTAGSSVAFSSYWGGTDADFAQGIAVDTAGGVYITGYTLSADIPLMDPGQGAYMDSTLGNIGMHDAFVAKCNSAGNSLNWSTYFGGGNVDLGMAIAADPQQGVFVTGRSGSTDFPLQIPSDNLYYQSTQGDGGNFNDFFISWFYNTGELKWSTYYGAANGEEGYGISIDASRNIFAGGLENNEGVVLKFGPGVITAAGAVQNEPQVHVYPDPVSEFLAAEFSLPAAQDVQLRILNMRGQLVDAWTVKASAGKNTQQTNVQKLPAGIYLLEIQTDGGILKKKFVKN